MCPMEGWSVAYTQTLVHSVCGVFAARVNCKAYYIPQLFLLSESIGTPLQSIDHLTGQRCMWLA